MSGIVCDVLGATKKHQIMQDTWGHTYPEPKSKHAGTVWVGVGSYGDRIILNDVFPTLNDSPIKAHLLTKVLKLFDFNIPNGLYEITCTLWFYKNCNDYYVNKDIGKIVKPKIKLVYSLDK